MRYFSDFPNRDRHVTEIARVNEGIDVTVIIDVEGA